MSGARRQLGARGEAAAARWYEDAGYRVLARNWRSGAGELDLVLEAPSGAVVVFCEVRTRTSGMFGTPLESVTVDKQRRLRRLAAAWLAGREGRPRVEVRFDVASVTVGASGRLVVEVVEEAF